MENTNNFEITAKSCVLFSETKESLLNEKSSFFIPIFQRPYSWNEQQINKLIDDIFRGYNNNENIFIGTMQVTPENQDGKLEIIDGQQRLTTFLLLFKFLNIHFNTKINALRLDWITTAVNNNIEQTLLDKVIESNEEQIIIMSELNQYAKNYTIISSIMNEYIIEDENVEKFNVNEFVNYINNNIYFIVIETKAGLSKTIQIFNAINTTGLDLNTGDLFKIRMYEYLKDIEGQKDDIFNRISELYSKIKENNEKQNANISNIDEILNIYKFILITKNNLPTVLYDYSSDRFYELLFNAILNKDYSEHFNKNNSTIKLSLDDIHKIIDVRFDWLNYKYKSIDIAASIHFIWWSRYSKYSLLLFLFLFRFEKEENVQHKLEKFIQQLSKLYFIYSIRFQKSIYEIHSFTHKLIKNISDVNQDFQSILNIINEKIGDIESHNNGWYNLNDVLKGDITYNSKLKSLVCRLSAFLEENNENLNEQDIKELMTKIFDKPIDIEHIQSYFDKDLKRRDDILVEWGSTINSIGNLVVLEYNINRSIRNKEFKEKIEGYKNSKYKIISSLIANEDWTLDKAEARMDSEFKKITDYLFEK